MKTLRENWLAISFVIASFCVVALVYRSLPDPVPTHWNWRGEIDGWMAKPWGALVVPLTQAGLIAAMVGLPRISPREAPMTAFARVYAGVIAALSAFFFALTVVTSLIARGVAIDMNQAISIASGLLFIVIGNVMGKFRRNFFSGIRTPWTLSNDEVWLRTHRLGGKLWVLSGLATIAAAFVGHGVLVLLVTIVASGVVLTVYSYVVYRALDRQQSR